jgi:hypothetical protein
MVQMAIGGFVKLLLINRPGQNCTVPAGAAWTWHNRLVSFSWCSAILFAKRSTPMTLRALLVVVTLILTGGPALAAASVARPAPREAPPPPMVFYVARGAPDACGRGCDSWIAIEGQVDSGAALRFRKFLRQIKDRNLPMYFSSPGGNLDQALAMGVMLRERPAVARVARTVVKECGFEAQNGEACLKLKQSGRELHGDLWTRGAMCNSACPYLILGATTREIAPDTVLAVHSPKVVAHFSGGVPTQQMRAAATERGLERADRMLSSYVLKMGAESALLDLAKTVNFESMHILTREEIARFGIDRRVFVETPWTFESNGRSMVRKVAVARSDTGGSYRTLQWRLFCFTAAQFELDFQRQLPAASTFSTVSISSGGPRPLSFTFPPAKPQGFEIWGLRMTRASVQSLADLPQFDFTETSFAPDGRGLVRPGKFSTEGLAGALDSLLATCPAQKDTAPAPANRSQDSAAK